jgi:hypothetical protein
MAEAIVAAVGKPIDMNIPEPNIARVDRNRLPTHSKWHGEGEMIGFVSMNAGQRSISFARLVNDEDYLTVSRWKDMVVTAAFDEWLANTDRNPGNIIYDAATDTYWLIDHGRALTGTYFNVWGIDDQKIKVNNLLIDRWPHKGDEHHTTQFIETSKKLLKKGELLDLSELLNDKVIADIDKDIDIQEIVDFIRDRLIETTDLICEKIKCPQQTLPLRAMNVVPFGRPSTSSQSPTQEKD